MSFIVLYSNYFYECLKLNTKLSPNTVDCAILWSTQAMYKLNQLDKEIDLICFLFLSPLESYCWAYYKATIQMAATVLVLIIDLISYIYFFETSLTTLVNHEKIHTTYLLTYFSQLWNLIQYRINNVVIIKVSRKMNGT